jgi:chitodextrinase
LTVTGLEASTAYTFTIRARDAAGNTSASSAALAVTTPVCPPDSTPPSVPGTPVASSITSTAATLTWAASTDNVGVAGYDVYRNGVLNGTSTGTSFNATGLSASTSYSFTVRARDAAGNVSAASSAVTFTTPPTGGGASCDVAYVVESQWSGGFTGKVTVKNTGTTAINGWTLRFSFTASGQGFTHGWGATWSASGAQVSAVNLDWNRTLAPGASTQLGFNGTWSGSNPEPPAFTLNNAACTVS